MSRLLKQLIALGCWWEIQCRTESTSFVNRSILLRQLGHGRSCFVRYKNSRGRRAWTCHRKFAHVHLELVVRREAHARLCRHRGSGSTLGAWKERLRCEEGIFQALSRFATREGQWRQHDCSLASSTAAVETAAEARENARQRTASLSSEKDAGAKALNNRPLYIENQRRRRQKVVAVDQSGGENGGRVAATAAAAAVSIAQGEVYGNSRNTLGGWLCFTGRDSTLLRRKIPSLSRGDRWRALLSRRLEDSDDEGEGEEAEALRGHVVNVLRGAQLGFTADECKKIVLKHPEMLTMGGLRPSERLTWMKENVGLDRDQLRAVVLKQPRLLSNSVDGSMAPVVQFLSEELGLSTDRIGAVVRKFPEILNLSVERTLVAKIRWFEETLGMERAEVARMVTTLPCLFGYRIEENMERKIAWLEDGLGTPRTTALGMMVRWPGIFTCSVERNLQPTLDFFHGELGGGREEVREAVIGSPRLLGASIEKRMRPRAARMLEEVGIVARFSDHRWDLACRTDAKFDEWLRQLAASLDSR